MTVQPKDVELEILLTEEKLLDLQSKKYAIEKEIEKVIDKLNIYNAMKKAGITHFVEEGHK